MALPTNTSRFAFLADDAADPFEKKKKKASASTNASASAKNKKPAGGGGGNKPKTVNPPANKNATTGSQGKKKQAATNNVNTADKNKNVPLHEDFSEIHLDSDRLQDFSESSSTELPVISNEGKLTDGAKKKSKKGKKAANADAAQKTRDPQWEEWQKRDQEFVTGSFESDLEAALIQSKLEHQKDESKPASKPRKNKNKAAAISLSEFNQMIGNDNGRPGLVDPDWTKSLNGFATIIVPHPPPGLVPPGGQFELDQDAALMEQFRRESQLEIERERRLEMERSILKSRPPIPAPQAKEKQDISTSSKPRSSGNRAGNTSSGNQEQVVLAKLLVEKDQTIVELTDAKSQLEEKYADLGTKFKKVCSMLADSQLKDKVKLLRDNEKLTQLNADLNEQVTLLHSQLEQEKSKCTSLAADLRKVEYSRKRTQSHTEMN